MDATKKLVTKYFDGVSLLIIASCSQIKGKVKRQ